MSKANRFEKLQHLKRSVSILHVCDAHGIYLTPLYNGDYVGPCPFHDDHENSFTVTACKNLWRCTPCGLAGNLLELVMRLEHLSRSQAVDRVLLHPGLIQRASELPRKRS